MSVISLTINDRLLEVPEGTMVLEAARKIGARYPITVYQKFTPTFPPVYLERAKKWGIIEE